MRKRAIPFLAVLALPLLAAAQAVIPVTRTVTDVADPAAPALYRGALAEETHVFRFSLDEERRIGATVAMPDLPDSKLDVSAALLRAGDEERPLAVLDAATAGWDTSFVVGDEVYRAGKGVTILLQSGDYEIRVWSSNNDSPYALRFDRIAPNPGDGAAIDERNRNAVKGGIAVVALTILGLVAFAANRRRRA